MNRTTHMMNLTAALAVAVAPLASVSAQQPPAQPPRPAQTARPATPAVAPVPAPPRAIEGQWELPRLADEMRELAREQARLGQAMAREEMEMARELAREQARVGQQFAREHAELAREQARMAGEDVRMSGQLARELADQARALAPVVAPMPALAPVPALAPHIDGHLLDFPGMHAPGAMPPAPWGQRDPADSLWRAANEAMNRGDYRRAAAIFKEIPQKFQYSAYAADAMYWTAHALYRVGSTPDLQEALQALDQLKQKYPNSRLRGSQTDVAALQVRIAGVLSARGQGGSEIVRNALAQRSSVCDTEEQQIRAAALNALMQTDEAAAVDYAQKMLARKDDCSREIRRTAVFLIGNRPSAQSVATLISVAKTDPAQDVRQSAVSYLGRIPGDEALSALEDLAKSDTAQQIQREAIRQLARSSSPRARAGIKSIIERNDVAENLRVTALDALDPERSTQEDVAWLQATYARVDSPRIKSRIISAMARIGGAQNERWFVSLANNESESIDVRIEALRRGGPSMDIAALGRLYDQTGQRQLRYELVRQLGNRREPESIDKLGDIAKTGTDPEVRKRAIEALMSKKDDRATKLVLQLIDRP